MNTTILICCTPNAIKITPLVQNMETLFLTVSSGLKFSKRLQSVLENFRWESCNGFFKGTQFLRQCNQPSLGMFPEIRYHVKWIIAFTRYEKGHDFYGFTFKHQVSDMTYTSKRANEMLCFKAAELLSGQNGALKQTIIFLMKNIPSAFR